MSNVTKAILLNLIATFLLAVMGALIKLLGNYYPAQELSLFRNMIGMIPTLIILFWVREWHQSGRPIRIRQWKLALSRGVFVAIAQFFFFLSLARMDLATVSTLVLATPVFLTLLSVPVLQDRVGPIRWLAVFIGLFGVILIIRPGTDIFTLIAIMPLLAALGYAASGVVVRLIDKSVPSALLNLYSQLGALIGALIIVQSSSGYQTVQSLEHWLWILAMGTFGGCGVFLLTLSYRLTQPSNIAPFGYFSIPFSFFLGWMYFDEAPLDQLFPGVILIVLSGLLIIWRDKRGPKQIESG